MKFLSSIVIGIVLISIFSCSVINNKHSKDSAMTIQKTLQQESFESLIIPIKSVEPDGDYTELEAMRPFFENKEIVALGESTHGTKEFWTYRHRMIRYMVEKLGFRIICLESNFSSTQMLNNYIKGGDGTSIQAVQALGGYIYNTKEFLNLIE